MKHEHDHRHLGARLDLFHFQEEAPGAAFWHPRGLMLHRILEAQVRNRIRREGYQEVRTPQVFARSLWERSGHWENFQDHLFHMDDEDRPMAVKPVSCPAHIELVKRMALSYRSLPLRMAEFGLCHRKERSGALHGLFRLFQFTQDDGHIFCAEEHVEDEVVRFTEGLFAFYRVFGFERIGIGLSLRPAQRAGDDAVWDRAEQVLESALRRTGHAYVCQPGEGAFYGPKLEFNLEDAQGRAWTCGTIQLDFVLPERFDLSYINAEGRPQRMVMLHRALLGAIERFMGFLLEHLGGSLPPWLAPEQFVLAPVKAVLPTELQGLLDQMEALGLRGRIDARNESLARKVADSRQLGIPWFIAFGPRDLEQGVVNIRQGEGESLALPRAEALAWMVQHALAPA